MLSSRLSDVSREDIETFHRTLAQSAEQVRRQLDKGVPRAKFAELHALGRALSRAHAVLAQALAVTAGK